MDAQEPLQRAEFKRPEKKSRKPAVDDKDPNVSDDDEPRGRGRYMGSSCRFLMMYTTQHPTYILYMMSVVYPTILDVGDTDGMAMEMMTQHHQNLVEGIHCLTSCQAEWKVYHQRYKDSMHC